MGSVNNNTFLVRDFAGVIGISDKINIGAATVSKDVAIKALENIERKDRIISFFAKRSVVILTGVIIVGAQLALLLIMGPAAFATLPIAFKVFLTVTRIAAFGLILFGIILGNSYSNGYKANADRAKDLLEKLRHVQGDSIHLKLIGDIKPFPDSEEKETKKDSDNKPKIVVLDDKGTKVHTDLNDIDD